MGLTHWLTEFAGQLALTSALYSLVGLRGQRFKRVPFFSFGGVVAGFLSSYCLGFWQAPA